MPFILLRFIALGSFVAGGVFVGVRDLAASPHSNGLDAVVSMLLNIPLGAVLSSFLSLPFGLLPASLAGLSYWVILSRRTTSNPKPPVRALMGSALGGIASGLFGGAFFSIGLGPGSYPFDVNLTAWIVSGIAGGAVSALATDNRTYAIAFKDIRSRSGA